MTKRKRTSQNQLSLPFGQGSVKAISYDDRARIFWMLAGLSIFSLCAYVYGVNVLARTVAERQDLEREAASLSADLATLEFEHIALKNKVTIEVAEAYGFKEVKKPLYVSRQSSAASLSFNTENR